MAVMHERQKIRNAVSALLTGNVTEVGARVFKSRASALWPDQELPCICIYNKEDKFTDRFGNSPGQSGRLLTLSIDIVVAGKEGNDDTLDSIAKQIEVLMQKDHTLSGTCEDLTLTDVVFGFKEDGAVPIAAARLSYEIIYIDSHFINP